MAIIKCKMCGGDLNIIEGQSVCECEYCGTRQTVPMLDDEKKMNLFTRANRLRFNSEFDKASGIYESIIADAPEEAEAYWGLVLCKYGIEYVDDPATGRKIPTCHRSSFDSVMQDTDFDLACEYADSIARKVYRQEAKQIEEIRKVILEVSSKEEPYDIFICYKETDENGDRTLDSVLAQDIYDALTDKGYRVFFARISLEDKLGQEYEPYIFAALNSARIMLAVGTDYDYYNAVWVKNEWSRFLKLMVKDKDKHLIPCYKNLDAYDMPQEFAKLQAQDLGKVGAIQDLLRGIEKLLGGAQETKSEQTVAVKAEAPGLESLQKRADMFLEDEEWDNAKEYYNRVLDIAPKCAEAYLGLSLADFQYVRMEQAAKERQYSFFNSKNMEKAERFADDALKRQILEARYLLEKCNAEFEDEQKQAEVRKIKSLELIRSKLKPVTNCLIGAGALHTVALKSDGTAVAIGDNDDGQCAVSDWTDIVAVSADGSHTVGLRSDGTVVAIGDNNYGQCEVSNWRDIVAISTDSHHTVGLKSDGTAVAVGENDDDQCNVSDWRDIVAISAGYSHTVGLKSNGTVVAVGDNDYGQCEVSNWRDIIAVSAGYAHTVGLKSDGTAVAVGSNNNGECDVSGWRDIVAISTDNAHTVGLKSDGTVVAVGSYRVGQCDVSDWTDIVAVSAGERHTVGLRRDGTVMATKYTGKYDLDQCEVSAWKLFGSMGTIEQERQDADEQRQEEARRAEERRKEEARKAEEKRKLEELRCSQGLCPYCGGTFKGLFKKVCSQCGKPKDY